MRPTTPRTSAPHWLFPRKRSHPGRSYLSARETSAFARFPRREGERSGTGHEPEQSGPLPPARFRPQERPSTPGRSSGRSIGIVFGFIFWQDRSLPRGTRTTLTGSLAPWQAPTLSFTGSITSPSSDRWSPSHGPTPPENLRLGVGQPKRDSLAENHQGFGVWHAAGGRNDGFWNLPRKPLAGLHPDASRDFALCVGPVTPPRTASRRPVRRRPRSVPGCRAISPRCRDRRCSRPGSRW